MESRIRERFNAQILAATATRYQINPAALRKLASAESYIYEFTQPDGDYILRIGHTLRRTTNLIHGEIDWINYLARGGAAVAPAIASANGRLVEAIDDGRGGHFLATRFRKAPGQPPNTERFDPAFAVRYGQAIGQMHRLTQTYTPTKADWQRPHWDDSTMQDALDFLPETESLARDQLLAQIEQLRTWPREPTTYGLVHQDAHTGNCFVDAAGNLTFFDFDDCCHSWFVADIAIVLFYMLLNREDPAAYAARFLPHFLRGYRDEYYFDPGWFAQIPQILKLRELELYALIHRSHDVENLTDPWDIRYMNGRKARIEQDLPFVELDFAQLTWP